MNQLEVAVPTPLARTFTYLAAEEVAPGSRVLVPFGRRRLVGVVLGPAKVEVSPVATDAKPIALKQIERVIDATPVYSAVVLEIARWISSYYMHPLGEVLRTMLPAGTAKVTKDAYELTNKGAEERRLGHTAEGRALALLFGAKKTLLSAATLKAKWRRISTETAAASNARQDSAADLLAVSVASLCKAGLLTTQRGTDLKARAVAPTTAANVAADVAASTPVVAPLPLESAEPAPQLTPRQREVFQQIAATGLNAAKAAGIAAPVYLLHGVTGSGKTEVYLHLIAHMLVQTAQNAQALVLVPEISLTPQMTRVFERRFPGLVAVVHSAMSDQDRWAELSRIRSGAAKILIGPRSAVFGPFKALGLLIVDEEHDGSYKQSTGLTYHGRDVAVLRGRLEGAPVVLGSATPSMESYNNALTGRYVLLALPERVTGRALPLIEVIGESGEASSGFSGSVGRSGGAGRQATLIATPSRPKLPQLDDDAEVPIDPRVLAALRANLAAGHQAIVLVNRRGYAYYLFSLEEKKAVQCPYCSISMTLHARSTVLRCHYCDYQVTVSKIVAEHPDDTFLAVGYGSQKAEDCLTRHLPGARIVRLDSDSVVQRDILPQTLAKFRAGDIDVLVGTQILAKGHDFPNVTLIVILEVDQLLGLPDFRAGERTFQLVVQAAGRAGRAELPGKVLLQTLRASHPVVTAAIAQDYKAFAERELRFRRQHAYPPFARMIALELNSPDQPRLVELCRRMEAWAEQMALMQPELVAKVRLLGPSVPPIERVRSRYRRTMIFSSDLTQPLRQLVGMFLATFQKLPADVRLRVDVDPQSLI